MLGVVIALIGVVLALIYVYLTWNFNFWRSRGVRGPKPRILKGNFEKTFRGECNFVEELHEIYLQYKANEKYVGVYMARSPALFILDPELALQVLTTKFSSFHDNESSKWTRPEVDFLRCCSPFVSVGEMWKERRNEIIPALTLSKLRSFYPIMQQAADKMVNFIDAHQNHIDAKEISSRFNIEMMADFIWGISGDAFVEEKQSRIHQAGSDMIKQAIKCVSYYGKTAAWPWIRRFKPERFFPEWVDEFFLHLNNSSIAHRLESAVDRPDGLNHLLHLRDKKRLTDKELAGHASTFLINGFETSSTAMAHCLLLLGRNKPQQDKLRMELVQNLDEDGGISFTRLSELPYLDQCVHEALRIYPVISSLFKVCTAPVTLDNSDGTKVLLNPGDTVYISAYSFHRDGDIFENPEAFIPERFDPDLGGSRKYRAMGAFLPFGDGPRICLGMKLGLLQMKLAVAEVVRKFHISVDSSTRLDNRVALGTFLISLQGGIVLNFTRVESNE